MAVTGGFSVCAIGVGCWLVSAAFAAESVLEQLQQAIRSGRSQQSADTAPGPAAPGGKQPTTSPTANAAAELSDASKPAVQQPTATGYLGAVADDTNDRGRGVRVIEVRPGSPAEKAGLRPQDLVTGVAGTRVRELADMASILSLFSPGDTIALDVRRGEQALQIKVTLGTRPGSPAQPSVQVPQPPPALPEPPGSPATVPPLPPPAGPALALPDSPEVAPPSRPAGDAMPHGPQSADVAELKQMLIQLQQRIEKLEARLAQLEKALAEPQPKP